MLSYLREDGQPRFLASGLALGLACMWKMQPYHRINPELLVAPAFAAMSRGQRSGVQ